MAYEELDSDFQVDDPVRASWMNQVGENSTDHEQRIGDLEESAEDHEDRLELLEGTGPSADRIFVSTTTLTNAQVKALPTAGIRLVAPPSPGYRIKYHNATLQTWFASGGYTNIDTADSYIVIGVTSAWLSNAIPNLSASSITHLSTFLTAAELLVDLPPYLEDLGGGYVLPNVTGTTTGAEAVELLIQGNNNGAGNWTGGHDSNRMTVVVYYSLEAVAAHYMPFTVSNIAAQQAAHRRRLRARPVARNQGMQI